MYQSAPTRPASAEQANVTATPPVAQAKLTTPSDTFTPAPYSLKDGALLYLPGTNEFVALYPEEWLVCRQDANEHEQAIREQQEANLLVTEKAKAYREALKTGFRQPIIDAEKDLASAISNLEKANKKLKAKLKPLGDLKAKGSIKLVEAVVLHKNEKKFAPRYINSEKLKQALADKRVYMVNGDAEKKKRTQEKIISGGKFNTTEIKKRIAEKAADKAKFEKKWKLAPEGEDAYCGVLTEWAKVMNGDIHHFLERQTENVEKYFNIDPNDPHRNVDVSAEAQLMRYTAGAGLEVNFNPFSGNLDDGRDSTVISRTKRALSQGKLGIKANAEASFAVAEGKVRTQWYVPHVAGWHANPTVLEQNIDLGWFRLMADLILFGVVGASVAAELDVALLYTANKQGIKGTPKDKKGAKAQTGASGELDVFAGAKAGVDLLGALQWMSPEGITDGRPRKVDPKKNDVAEYVNVAEVHPKVEGQAGASGTLGFKIDYKSGKFVIHAKAGLCIGLGGKGDITFAVSAATIGEFFKCVSYQLKHVDWKKVDGLIQKDAYKAFASISALVAITGDKLENYVTTEWDDLTSQLKLAMAAANKATLDRLSQELRTWGFIAYLPPEAQGTVVNLAMEIGRNNPEIREQGASCIAGILACQQTNRQKEELLQRICMDIDGKEDRAVGRQKVTAFLATTSYANALTQTDTILAQAQSIQGRPFMRNDESAFVTAKIGIDHPTYENDWGHVA
ncbi:MAG: hypothetical protein P4L87_01065 [Formivibrio sp.]|nr:hypothetical protein [Formivibrio sp.]